MDLVQIMGQGSVKALVLHSNEKPSDESVKALKDIISTEWQEFLDTLDDAVTANMGDTMYKQIMNTFCNAWAVRALSQAEVVNA